MSKVIIKPIIHLPDKSLNDFYKFINDQYQKNDVVIVPYYCEVYVVDGNPELKVEEPVDHLENPTAKTCWSCIHGMFESSDVCDMCKCRSKWEAKNDSVTDTSSDTNGRL